MTHQQYPSMNDKIASLRARLRELLVEQKNWQDQLQEIGEGMAFDDVRNQIKQANDRIEKHKEIITKCEKRGETGVTIEKADIEYNISNDSEGLLWIYSANHSKKRIAFWKDEIAKYEQKLKMMEIAQQQLTEVIAEIAEINAQIQKTTTSLTSEPLVAEQSNKIGNVSIPENNKVSKDWIYTDKATSEDKERFEKHIEYLCGKKISAQQIKRYIKEQENDSILEHIDFTKQYEILKGIGVDFKKKTFLNA